MDAMGAVGEDTPEPSDGVEVVDVDVATAATERLNLATTMERMLLRTARSLPKARCATTAMLEVTSLPTAGMQEVRWKGTRREQVSVPSGHGDCPCGGAAGF